MRCKGKTGRGFVGRCAYRVASAHPAREAEGIREREDALAHLADRDDNVAPITWAHRAPDDGQDGPIRRMCGEGGEGGAGQRDADISVSHAVSQLVASDEFGH